MAERELHVSAEELPNGETLFALYDEHGDLKSVGVKRPDVVLCHNCAAEIGRHQAAYAIGGNLFCEACGRYRLRAKSRLRRMAEAIVRAWRNG